MRLNKVQVQILSTESWYLRIKIILRSRVTRNTIILCSMYNTKITYGVKVGTIPNVKICTLFLIPSSGT